ncbi:MAG: DUF192 domain-containing protein [archaeon]
MLLNKSTKKIISRKHKVADTFLKRAIGLMFHNKKKFNYALVFDLERITKTGASLHMFFVFFKINVLFLDSSKRIVEIKKDFMPFETYSPKKPARYIIEIPTSFKNYKISHKLEWN